MNLLLVAAFLFSFTAIAELHDGPVPATSTNDASKTTNGNREEKAPAPSAIRPREEEDRYNTGRKSIPITLSKEQRAQYTELLSDSRKYLELFNSGKAPDPKVFAVDARWQGGCHQPENFTDEGKLRSSKAWQDEYGIIHDAEVPLAVNIRSYATNRNPDESMKKLDLADLDVAFSPSFTLYISKVQKASNRVFTQPVKINETRNALEFVSKETKNHWSGGPTGKILIKEVTLPGDKTALFLMSEDQEGNPLSYCIVAPDYIPRALDKIDGR